MSPLAQQKKNQVEVLCLAEMCEMWVATIHIENKCHWIANVIFEEDTNLVDMRAKCRKIWVYFSAWQ
jgi:hypothetical protein